eukprot:1964414-Pleurochrysis_carterae.AAC.1
MESACFSRLWRRRVRKAERQTARRGRCKLGSTGVDGVGEGEFQTEQLEDVRGSKSMCGGI